MSIDLNNSESENENWLKIGKTFGKKEEEIENVLNRKRKAVDFFSSDEEEDNKYKVSKEKEGKGENIIQGISISKYKDTYSISDFSSDDEERVVGEGVEDKQETITCSSINNITKNFLIRNVFEIEDNKKYTKPDKPKDKSISNLSSSIISKDIYCAEDIIDRLSDLNKKKKRKFFNKFELKKIKYHDADLLFTIDNLPVKDNYKYGNFQKKDIPRYYRIKTNQIFGIKNVKLSSKIINDLNELIGVYKKYKSEDKKRLRYFDADYTGISTTTFSNSILNSDEIKLKINKIKFDFEKDYVYLIQEKNKNFQAKTTDKDLTDLKIDYNLFESDTDKLLLQKNKEFNKKISQEPSNTKLWFDYINFQDVSSTSTKEKSKREIKLNILEKALSINLNKNNFLLNILYLRIFEEANFENFDLINDEWLKKLKIHFNKKEFLIEYLTFLKTRKKMSINDIRDYYLNLIKFYETIYLESCLSQVNVSNEEILIFISQLIIDILIDLVTLEKESGYFERSFNILRSFLEANCLRFKNILKEKYFEDYVIYFDSEYPKLGDFENGLGFIDYFQKKEKINFEFFNKTDFIEYLTQDEIIPDSKMNNSIITIEDELTKFIENESQINYRSLNICYDKDNLELKPESFIFYSDIKDYVELKLLINSNTLLYLIKNMNKYFGIEITDTDICFSCSNDLILNNMPKLISKDEKNELRFLFEDKFLLHKGKFLKYENQIYIYFLRLYDYIEKLNIVSENDTNFENLFIDEILIMKMDLIFLNKNNSEEFKINFAKSTLKIYQTNNKIWLNYYKWCLFLKKYEDAEKIIKLLNSKKILIKNNNNLNEMEKENNDENLLIKIKTYSISHYIYYLLMGNPKYNLNEFNLLINTNLQFLFDFLSLGNVNQHFHSDNINKLEKVLQNNKTLSYYLYTLILTVLICLYLNVKGENNIISQNYLIDKFRLVSNYTNLVQLYAQGNNCKCKHLLKQEISLFMIRIFFLLNFFNNFTPKFIVEILENINNFNLNKNDIFIILLSKYLCHFSNPIDRELKFLSHYGNSASLKHYYYLLNTRFRGLSPNCGNNNISTALNYYKNYWNLYNHNLYKLSYSFENFDRTKTLIEGGQYTLILNSKVNSSKILLYYLKDLIKIIKIRGLVELHHFLDYSLFLVHEYSYSKAVYLKFIKDCKEFIESNISEENKKMIKKHIKHFIDIIKLKEIRLQSNINKLNL